MSKTYNLVIDPKRKQAACVLLQAVYGGDREGLFKFFPERWLVAPTDDMIMVSGTEEQWKTVSKKWGFNPL